MLTLKGFYTYSPLIDNTIDVVSLLGELSSDGRTYGKDKQQYTDETTPLTSLVAFHSVRDGNVTRISDEVAGRILRVGHYLYGRAVAGQVSDNAAALIQSILNEFSEEIEAVQIGEIIADGSIRLPEWISFSLLGIGESNEIRVWFSDQAFRRQYNEYTIEIIPPMDNLDDFFLDPSSVIARLRTYSILDTMTKVQAVRGEYPFTMQLANDYAYRGSSDPEVAPSTYWVVIVYGQAGNNPDVIKHAIIDYILANSTHDRTEWEAILPDLFVTTEFIITPFWHQYSVPNMTLQAGIYSPVIRPSEHLDLLTQTTKGTMYTETWVRETAEITANIYKSIAFGVVANPNNRDGLDRFTKLFPDYMLVTNDSSDFNRISPYTQEWMVLLGKMFQVAESFDLYTAVPLGYSRVVRDGVLYLAATYDGITYLMVSKPALDSVLESL